MRERRLWTRRAMLGSLGRVGLFSMMPAAMIRAGKAWQTPSDLPSVILDASFVDVGSAAVVGREYLLGVPEEADAQRLATELLAGWPAHSERKLNRRLLNEYLADQRKRDFELGRTARVGGWVLSRTEARLCALAEVLA